MLRGWDEGYEIPSFGIVADFRQKGRGHGSRIWRLAMGYAADLGAKKMRITTHLHNAIILGMAEKLGFRRTKELPNNRVELIADLELAPAGPIPAFRSTEVSGEMKSDD
jgi:ribosomal protein S18 acetylase RimI-like enzyme